MIKRWQQYFRGRESLSILVGVVLLALLLGMTLAFSKSFFGVGHDLKVYHGYSLLIVQGYLPYLDFGIEYPPLSILPMLIPQWANFITAYSYSGYVILFSIQNILIVCTIGYLILKVAVIQQVPRTVKQLLMIYAFVVVLNSPLILWRYDIFCALLTIWALWLLLTDRPLLAGMALGLGIAAKLYPVLLVPLFVIHACDRKKYKAALQVLLGSAIVLVLMLVLVSPLGLDNLLGFVAYHKLRGLQLESLPAGVLLLLHNLGWVPVNLVLNYGAYHLESPVAPPILQVFPLVAIAGFLGTLVSYVRCLKERQNTSRSLGNRYLVLYILVALLVFMSTNKVFSPQYLIWLIPFVCLIGTRQIILFSVISILSFLIFPVLYIPLIINSLPAILLLNLRNGLVVFLALWLLRISMKDGSKHSMADSRVLSSLKAGVEDNEAG